jgi:hypothetical protein
MRVERPSGSVGRARPRIESVISERTFEEFLDAKGTWDNERERKESHVDTEDGSTESCSSRDLIFSWFEENAVLSWPSSSSLSDTADAEEESLSDPWSFKGSIDL